MDLAEARIGVLGLGAMGSALCRGWLGSGTLRPGQLFGFDPVPIARDNATQLGLSIAGSARELCELCDMVWVVVKPPDVARALEAAFAGSRAKPLVCSVAAGVPLTAMEEQAPGRPLIRVMPNTPALVGAGASAFARGPGATAEHAAAVTTLLGAVGTVCEVTEPLLDAVTGLSGSGPAYAYVIIEALADGGVRCGLPRATAYQLAAQTLLGAAKMVLETGEHPGLLKDRVSSPGGTTIAGLAVLEQAGLRGALIEAVTAATRRATELA